MTPLRSCFARNPGSPGSLPPAAVVAAGEPVHAEPTDGSFRRRSARPLGLGFAALTALTAASGMAGAESAPRVLSGGLAALSQDPPPRPVPIEAFYDVLRDHGTFIDSDRYGVLFCPHPDEVGADFQPYLRGHWIHVPRLAGRSPAT